MEYHVRNLTALGLLVLIAGGLFIWGFFFLMGDPIFVGGTQLVVTMQDGAGLNRGDKVLLNGVQVGTVGAVRLQPPAGVTADVRVDGDFPLPADSRALIRSDVFGAATVELVPGRALVALEDGDTIRGTTATALPQLASELGGQARTILASADSLLSPQAVSDLRATAHVLPDVAVQMRAAFAELSRATASFRRTAEEMERAGTGPAAAETLAELRGSARAATRAIETLDLSFGSLGSVIEKIDRGDGTLGRLVNDTSLYGELNATLRQVRELAADVQANPKKYVSIEVF